MSSNTMSEDLRIIKTKKALSAAMFSLLKSYSFKKITIKEICEEALVSRATFYAHFIDKYDLLKHWMIEFWPYEMYQFYTFEQTEGKVNRYLLDNMGILKNLVIDADDETISILFDFIISTIDLSIAKNDNDEEYAKNVVLANFYAGGVLSYIKWLVNNKCPPEVLPMNRPMFDMLLKLQDMHSKQR